MIPLTDKEFLELRDYVLNNYGIDLTKKRMLISGRLTSVLQQYGYTNFTQYIDRVKGDKTGTELQVMLNRLTTNLTYFLREKEHFNFLLQRALPEFEQRFRGRQLRVWSAGCSSGEEPYTLAMTLMDYFKDKGGAKNFTIFASDISQNVLGQGQRAVYSKEALKDVPKAWLTRYFNPQGDEDYIVKDEIRKTVTFKPFNLMEPFRFRSPFELIFCRNVMIYFDKEKKDNLISKYYTWLSQGGYFFISHSENIGRSDVGFQMVRPSIFYKA